MTIIDNVNAWFDNLSFYDMELLTGIYRYDYIDMYDDDLEADEMFIEACENWWNEYTDESKIAIHNNWFNN